MEWSRRDEDREQGEGEGDQRAGFVAHRGSLVDGRRRRNRALRRGVVFERYLAFAWWARYALPCSSTTSSRFPIVRLTSIRCRPQSGRRWPLLTSPPPMS